MIQNLVIHPFDRFLPIKKNLYEHLVNQFDIHKIIIGHDHRFGRIVQPTLTTYCFENMDLRSNKYL
jgi:FAD synthase